MKMLLSLILALPLAAAEPTPFVILRAKTSTHIETIPKFQLVTGGFAKIRERHTAADWEVVNSAQTPQTLNLDWAIVGNSYGSKDEEPLKRGSETIELQPGQSTKGRTDPFQSFEAIGKHIITDTRFARQPTGWMMQLVDGTGRILASTASSHRLQQQARVGLINRQHRPKS